MPSRRHNAAIDSSPRRPSSTMRIFSSAPYCLRVARRMSFATCSAEAFCVPAFCLIFAPLKGYDEPEILPSQLSRFCLISADAGHRGRRLLTEGGERAVGRDEPVVGSSEVRRLEERVRDLERLLGRKTMEVEILKDALAKSESKKPSLRLLSQPRDGSR